MYKLFLILTVAFLTACETLPTNPEFWMEREVNACLPTAIIFKESLKKYGVWAEVFRYSWTDKQNGRMRGHAMVAYLYPKGKNQLWTYDAMGSYRIIAFTNDLTTIAQISHNTRGNTEKIFRPEWIK